jgi:hypothetical protein
VSTQPFYFLQLPGFLPMGIKRQGREVDQSPKTIAEGKETCINTFTLSYAFKA